MATTAETATSPLTPGQTSAVHPLASLSFLAAIVAILLAFYGSIAGEKRIPGSPLNVARLESGPGSSAEGPLVGALTFLFPCLLGTAAALAAGWAMRSIERSAGRYRGDAIAVFAILIGSFAAIIGGCMILAVYLWPYIPSLYTT